MTGFEFAKKEINRNLVKIIKDMSRITKRTGRFAHEYDELIHDVVVDMVMLSFNNLGMDGKETFTNLVVKSANPTVCFINAFRQRGIEFCVLKIREQIRCAGNEAIIFDDVADSHDSVNAADYRIMRDALEKVGVANVDKATDSDVVALISIINEVGGIRDKQEKVIKQINNMIKRANYPVSDSLRDIIAKYESEV